MRKQLHMLIYGRVQGVYYRESTKEEALKLGLVGWVKNLPDGSVEAVAEGEEEALEALYLWCQDGPSLANVSRIEKSGAPATDAFTKFEVRY